MQPQKVTFSRKRKKSRKIFSFDKTTKKWKFVGMKPKKTPEYKLIEFKSLDTAFTMNVVANNSSTTIAYFNLTVLGNDIFNRIGRKINLRSLLVRITFAFNDGGTPYTNAFDTIRTILFWDKNPNTGTALVPSDIIRDVGNSLNQTVSTSSFNVNNRNRIKVIRDEMRSFAFNKANPISAQIANLEPTAFQIKWFLRFPKGKLNTVYNNTNGGTIADINAGALGIMFQGDNGPTNFPFIADVTGRLRFTDD